MTNIPPENILASQESTLETHKDADNIAVSQINTEIRDQVEVLLTNLSPAQKAAVIGHVLSEEEENTIFIRVLREKVLDHIGTHTPFTHGQEWEVYKIHIDGSTYLIAKKRFDNNCMHEVAMQQKAYDISKTSLSWVRVPRIVDNFRNGKDEYIVMEYVPGKTLYCLIFEKIVEQSLLQHFSLQEVQDYISPDGSVHFEDDEDAKNKTNELLNKLYIAGKSKENPQSFVIDKNGNKRFLIEQVFNDHITKIQIFNEQEKKQIQSQLHKFIGDMHTQWLHHRDVWANTRNIMFVPNPQGWYILYLIDFGRAQIGVNEVVYRDELNDVSYASDMAIITLIKNIGSEYKQREVLPFDIQTIEKHYESIFHRSPSYIERHILGKQQTFRKMWGFAGLFATLMEKNSRTRNWHLHFWKELSSEQRKDINNLRENLFFFLLSSSSEDREILEREIEQWKSQSKWSRAYKIAIYLENFRDEYNQKQ